MYNEQLKQEYLADAMERNTDVNASMSKLFTFTEKYETQLDRDLCNFSVVDIVNYYKFLCSTSFERLENLNSQYKLYTAYCMSRHLVLDGQNHFEEITKDVLVSCVNMELAKQKIITRADLMKVVNGLLNPSDKMLVLGCFEGIGGDGAGEFIGITASSIKGNILHTNQNRDLSISDELKTIIYDSINEYTYYSIKGSRSYSLLTSDNSALKYRTTGQATFGEMNTGIIERRMTNIKKEVELNSVNRKSLMASGRIHYINQLIKNGKSLDEAVRDKELNYRYTRIASPERFIEKYKEFLGA